MILTIHGLPIYVKYADVKTLVRQESSVVEFSLDNLTSESENSKKVSITIINDRDAANFIKCLDGFRMAGNVLRVVPQGNIDQGGYPQRNYGSGDPSFNRADPGYPMGPADSMHSPALMQRPEPMNNRPGPMRGPPGPILHSEPMQGRNDLMRGPGPMGRVDPMGGGDPMARQGSVRPGNILSRPEGMSHAGPMSRQDPQSHPMDHSDGWNQGGNRWGNQSGPNQPIPQNNYSYQQKPAPFRSQAEASHPSQPFASRMQQDGGYGFPPKEMAQGGPMRPDGRAHSLRSVEVVDEPLDRPLGKPAPPRQPISAMTISKDNFQGPQFDMDRREPYQAQPMPWSSNMEDKQPFPKAQAYDRKYPEAGTDKRKDMDYDKGPRFSPRRDIHPTHGRMDSPGRRREDSPRGGRYSPRRDKPVDKYPHPAQAKDVRPAYDGPLQAPNQAMYSGYREKAYPPGRPQEAWQDRFPKKEDDRRDVRMNFDREVMEKRPSRSPVRRGMERSPPRDRYVKPSLSPRSPRRSWALEKRGDVPPPPNWPGPGPENEYRRGFPVDDKKRDPLWERPPYNDKPDRGRDLNVPDKRFGDVRARPDVGRLGPDRPRSRERDLSPRGRPDDRFPQREPVFEPRDPKFEPRREPAFEPRDVRDPKFEPRREPKFEPRREPDPKFEPRDPKFAPRRDPKFEPRREPDFQQRDPIAARGDPKFESRDPKFEPRRDPKFEPRDSKFEHRREPVFEPRDPKFEPRRDPNFEPRFNQKDPQFEPRRDPKFEPRDSRYDQKDPKFEPRVDPKFEPRESRFDQKVPPRHEPKLGPRDSRFDQNDPKFEPRVDPKFEPRASRFDQKDPKFEPRHEPRFDQKDPKFEPRDPQFKPREPVFEGKAPRFEPRKEFDDHRDRRAELDIIAKRYDNEREPFKGDPKARHTDLRRDDLPRRDEERKLPIKAPLSEFNKEFDDVFKRSLEFKQKVDELRRSGERRRELDDVRDDRRLDRRPADDRKMGREDDHRRPEKREPEWIRPRDTSEVKAKREKAIEEVSQKIMQKYGGHLNPEQSRRVNEELKKVLFKIFINMFEDKDVSFIEMVVKFNARHDEKAIAKIFYDVMEVFPASYRKRHAPDERDVVPAKTARMSNNHLKRDVSNTGQPHVPDWSANVVDPQQVAAMMQQFDIAPQMGMQMMPVLPSVPMQQPLHLQSMVPVGPMVPMQPPIVQQTSPMFVKEYENIQQAYPDDNRDDTEDNHFNLYLCKDDFEPYTTNQSEYLKKFLVSQIIAASATSEGWTPDFTLKGLQSIYRYELVARDEATRSWIMNLDFSEFHFFNVLVYTKEELWYERAAIWLPGHSKARNIEPLEKLILQNKHLDTVNIGKWKLVKKIVTAKGTRLYVDMPPSAARALEKYKMVLSYELQKVNVFLKAVAVDKEVFDMGLKEISIKDDSVIQAAIDNSPMPSIGADANVVKITLKGNKALTVDQARMIKEMLISRIFKYHQDKGTRKTDFVKFGFCLPGCLAVLPENHESRRWLEQLNLGKLYKHPIVVLGAEGSGAKLMKVNVILQRDYDAGSASLMLERLKLSNQGEKGLNFSCWKANRKSASRDGRVTLEVSMDMESIETLSKLHYKLDYIDGRKRQHTALVKYGNSTSKLEEFVKKHKAECSDIYDVANMDLDSGSESDIVYVGEVK